VKISLPRFLQNGIQSEKPTIILAHGAGAPMDSLYMQTFAIGLAERGLQVVRFEFPYMSDRRKSGIKKPPNRAPILLETWAKVVDYFGSQNLIIGGKSMGGRIASMYAEELETNNTPVKGIVCLGYPFHSPGRSEKLRTEHLISLKTPTLICQGERDAFGTQEDVKSYTLSKSIRYHWLTDGDHGFKPRKKSGFTEQQNWNSAMDAIEHFIRSLK
jgi:predicted alpha/beta-hydrolase family hydrolase